MAVLWLLVPYFLNQGLTHALGSERVSPNHWTTREFSDIYFFKPMFLFSLDKIPEVELLDHLVVLFLIFWGTPPTVFHSGYPIYIPINNAQGVPYLYVLAYTCYYNRWSNSSWLQFAFPWWLVILSIFSCACWPSAYFFEKMSIQVLYPFLIGLFLSFFFDVESYEFFVLDVKPLVSILFASIFSHSVCGF